MTEQLWYVRPMINEFRVAIDAPGMGNVFALRQRLLAADWSLAQVIAAENLAIREHVLSARNAQ